VTVWIDDENNNTSGKGKHGRWLIRKEQFTPGEGNQSRRDSNMKMKVKKEQKKM